MSWKKILNEYGKAKIPCFFVIDFLGVDAHIIPLNQLHESEFKINFNGFVDSKIETKTDNLELLHYPIRLEDYQKAFERVQYHLQRGDSYLTNLTFETPIAISTDLEQIFEHSKAKYKILKQNNWVCFSPETFIQISDNQISTFPMKGTIDATIPNAAEILKNHPKEKAEHFTIVDLLRNDLSMVAKKVSVKKLMYLDEIETMKGKILQMSSEIVGNIGENWHENLGDIFATLLPAGSISGAPKKKTMEIISSAENYKRGFYTGIAGIFTGVSVDSCVLIRFIEKIPNGFVYKSGGGITAMSNLTDEYNELQQKIYVPIY